MRVTYRGSHETGLKRAFMWSLLFGGTIRPNVDRENPNRVGDLCKFDEDSLKLVIDEGRIQLANQDDRFRHATDRGQMLLTVNIALIGFLAALLHHLLQLHQSRRDVAIAFWVLAVLLVLFGTGFAAAVVSTKANFTQIDTTEISRWKPPVLQELARDYADSVRLGEITVAMRVTVFRVATRLTLWGALVAAIAFVVSA